MKFTSPSTWWRGPRPPRKWQAEAMEAAVCALSGNHPKPSIIQAVMGAGKSVLISEICAQAVPGANDAIVVTTSSVALVEQLSASLAERMDPDLVGRFYTHAKEANRRVIVACVDSAERLAKYFQDVGRRCLLWIADEAHRTESAQIHRAHADLQPHATLGFTATPYRSRRSEELSLFVQLVYQYGPSDGLRDGVILPWRVVPWTGADVQLDDACISMIREVMHIGPGVANAGSVKDAEEFAAVLNASGIRAKPIHSYLDKATQRERLESLRTRALDCLVHVAMLQEGVDFPWLMWLCLRRKSSSRVRFAQEVGRVLRGAPGKTEGVILDPLDLFGVLKLSYAAVLQGQAEDSAETVAVEIAPLEDGWWATSLDPLEAGFARGRLVRIFRRLRPTPCCDLRVLATREGAVRFDGEPTLQPIELLAKLAPELADEVTEAAEIAALPIEDPTFAVALEDVTRYLRVLTIELEQRGNFDRRTAARAWRDSPVTRQQWDKFRATITLAAERATLIPEPHRSALRNACLAAHKLRRGQVSDLTDILGFVAQSDWPLGESKAAA